MTMNEDFTRDNRDIVHSVHSDSRNTYSQAMHVVHECPSYVGSFLYIGIRPLRGVGSTSRRPGRAETRSTKWFGQAFDRLMVLSKVEGLTTLSPVEKQIRMTPDK